ncbi:DUF1775 domain-containing protein [Solirubrobacter phytolaccae]|uniref:DUF1775 domain-containing protein n=1 Tax=Solirubrobacter phytolaccae TaxID=1404360 RepID=A0A9X3SAJ1_9ACTN|nr:DUF1775 domain-containing protein [Solirubrobacter phytolaccae]MDA0182601.1 DUF1775 domain-containing protein [Solirubrobacter phytolaccae]
MPRWLVPPLAVLAALVICASAFAHPSLSPPLVEQGVSQLFTLAVPTEKDGVTTTQIELTPPEGFAIEAFVPAQGWKRTADQSGSGEDVVIRKATFTGGATPSGEAAVIQFVGYATEASAYDFRVRQTYSDGTVVSWTGEPSSETPAARVEAKAQIGGGSGSLAIIAFVIATAALVAGAIALLLQAGNRDLA